MVIKRDMYYSPRRANRPLHIYLPDDYGDSQERYPVMYFFDGHNLFYDEDATYGKSWGLKDFLDHWNKKMIIVGMECGHNGEERLGEYSPYFCYWKKEKEFCGDETFQWIVHEVKPLIDREYRTYSFREATGIAGSSMGGLMAIYGAVKYNQWFSKAACLSSAISFCMDPLIRDMYAHPVDPDTRVYLAWGTKEAYGIANPDEEDFASLTRKHNLRVADILTKQGALPYIYCQVGGGHCEADWEKQVPIFMDFLWMH